MGLHQLRWFQRLKLKPSPERLRRTAPSGTGRELDLTLVSNVAGVLSRAPAGTAQSNLGGVSFLAWAELRSWMQRR
jgi:hypothetical protein